MRDTPFIRNWFPAALFLVAALVFMAARLEVPAGLMDRFSPPEESSPRTNAAFWGVTDERGWKGFPEKIHRTNEPWGDIEKALVQMEAPDHGSRVDPSFWDVLPWTFEVESTSQISEIFARADRT
jgi:hypothetical protein